MTDAGYLAEAIEYFMPDESENSIERSKSMSEIVLSSRDANSTDEGKGKTDINHTGSDGLRFGSSFRAEE